MKVFKLVFMIFASAFFLFSQDIKCLKDSKWYAEIVPEHYSYYFFKNDSIYEEYDSELNEKFFGIYLFSNDTLFLYGKDSEYEESHSSKKTITKFIFKDGKMIPKYFSFQYDNGKWSEPKLIFDENYFFIKDSTLNK